MDQHTPRENPDAIQILDDQIRECFGRVVYSHKVHEKDADILTARLSAIKILQIALSAIVTGGLATTLLGNPGQSHIAAIVSVLLSTCLLALNAYAKSNDLGQVAEKHKESAAKLWIVREGYLSLLTDIKAGITASSDIIKKREQLQEMLSLAYSGAPRTSNRAYRKAGVALKDREELTFNDGEIEKFLPESLKRNDR